MEPTGINWRYVIIFFVGALAMYVVLSYVSHKSFAPGQTSAQIKKLLGTQQFSNLVKTNEFREIAKTKEFRDLMLTLAEDEIRAVSNALSTDTY